MVSDGRRPRVKALGLILGMATILAGTGAAFADASLTGDADGIRIAHDVERAYLTVTSYTVTERRFVFMRARAGRHGYFDWNWGVGTAPAGWVSATERELVVTHQGRVVWMRDDLTPNARACSGHRCVRYPGVEVLVEPHGQYFRFGSAATPGCFYRLSGTVPVHSGDPAYRLSGYMLDPAYQRTQVLLNYDYQWDANRRAGETDVVSYTTRLVTSGQVDLSAWGTEPSFIFGFTLGYPATHPREPPVALCHS
jgi:hypothetical protein